MFFVTTENPHKATNCLPFSTHSFDCNYFYKIIETEDKAMHRISRGLDNKINSDGTW